MCPGRSPPLFQLRKQPKGNPADNLELPVSTTVELGSRPKTHTVINMVACMLQKKVPRIATADVEEGPRQQGVIQTILAG